MKQCNVIHIAVVIPLFKLGKWHVLKIVNWHRYWNYTTSFMMCLLCKWCHIYHVLTFLMMLTDSAVSVHAHKVRITNSDYLDQILLKMTQADKLFTDYRGRERGLIKILDEERQRCNRLWVTTCPTPGWGTAETLTLLTEKVTKNEPIPGCGCGQQQTLGRRLAIPNPTNHCNLEPVKTWGRTPGPHLQGPHCPPLWQPVCWPKYLGRASLVHPHLHLHLSSPLYCLPIQTQTPLAHLLWSP